MLLIGSRRRYIKSNHLRGTVMKKLLLTAACAFAFSQSALAQEEIVIGAILPLSGTSATQGQDQQRGIDLAIEKLNAEGGVLGRPLRVIVEDSTSRAATAVDAAMKLATVDRVPVVIGEFSSGVTIPIGEYLLQQGVAHLNIASTSGRLRQLSGGGFYSLIGLDNVSGPFAAEDVYEAGGRRIAAIAPNNAFGQGMIEEFKKRYLELGGEIVAEILYTEGQTSYRRELQQLEAANPDYYIYTAFGREAATINRESYELGLNELPWYGMYLSMCTGDSEPEHIEGQVGFEVNYIGPEGGFYQEAYEEKYGHYFVSSFNGYGYDAVMMAAAAIEAAGNTERADIITALSEVGQEYEAVTGEITFDEGFRSSQPYLRLKIEDGMPVVF